MSLDSGKIKSFIKNNGYIRNNIFAKYFILFATIFLVVLTILGTTLTLLVSAYTQSENTKLLKENVRSVVDSIGSTFIAQDMNDNYTLEKGVLCSSLSIISASIDRHLSGGNATICRSQ